VNAQLELAERQNKPKRKRAPAPAMCKCGHAECEHRNGVGACMACSEEHARVRSVMGPLTPTKACRRFKNRKRIVPPTPLELLGPMGSVAVWRPDTVNPKPMGWGHIEERELTLADENGFEGCRTVLETRYTTYLAQLKAESPNNDHIPNDPVLAHRIKMGKKASVARQVERTSAAFAQLAELEGIEFSDHPLPFMILLTRVSFGVCDNDNAIASLKWIEDGVCDALGFDDSDLVQTTEYSPIGPLPPGKVWIRYDQGDSFKAGIFGVRIEVVWRDP